MDDWSDIASAVSDFTDVDMPSSVHSVSDMAESDTGNITLTWSMSVSEFNVVGTPVPSEFDSIETPFSMPNDSEVCSADATTSTVLPDNTTPKIVVVTASDGHQAAENASDSLASKLLIAEEKTWKAIHEEAGGSLQRYHEMMLEKIKNGRNGVIFPPEAAIPDEGELVGDKKPGYEAMALTEKLFAWWTRKQWKIFNSTVLEELKKTTGHSAETGGNATAENNFGMHEMT